MKTVSLIIPVYNTAGYLEKCLQSALEQTYPAMEIICIDDGSTDGSDRIADELAKSDSRLHVIHQENVGISGARNRGLLQSTGDYIAFMDSDDWIEKDMYARLVESIEQSGADLAASGWIYENGDDRYEVTNAKKLDSNIFGRDQLIEYLYERDSYRAFAYMWDKLYKRELIFSRDRQELKFDESLRRGEDVLFLGEIALRTKKAVFLESAFYHYRRRMDSETHSLSIEKSIEHLSAYIRLISLFSKENVPAYALDMVKRFLAYHCSNAAELAYRQKKSLELSYCQRIMKQYQNEYEKLNQNRPDWISRYRKIIDYKIDG